MVRTTFALLVGLTLVHIAISAKKPNVLCILVDDMGWKDLSSEGSTFYESPHVDRISKRLN